MHCSTLTNAPILAPEYSHSYVSIIRCRALCQWQCAFQGSSQTSLLISTFAFDISQIPTPRLRGWIKRPVFCNVLAPALLSRAFHHELVHIKKKKIARFLSSSQNQNSD